MQLFVIYFIASIARIWELKAQTSNISHHKIVKQRFQWSGSSHSECFSVSLALGLVPHKLQRTFWIFRQDFFLNRSLLLKQSKVLKSAFTTKISKFCVQMSSLWRAPTGNASAPQLFPNEWQRGWHFPRSAKRVGRSVQQALGHKRCTLFFFFHLICTTLLIFTMYICIYIYIHVSVVVAELSS